MKYHTVNNEMVKKYTIKEILVDHWRAFEELMKTQNKPIRQVIMDEVKKVIGCQEQESGYSLYFCTHCNSIKYVLFTCKSRFCNSCGAKYSKDRALSIQSKIIDHPHRHAVFTIPKELRSYFQKDRSLLHYLFKAASETVTYHFKQRNKSEEFMPGMICVLHTFGRDLKWNPHIHMILSEGGIGNNIPWCNFNHINYEALRHSFQYLLLKFLSSNISDPTFKILVDNLYKVHTNGFYVRALPNKPTDNATAVVSYIVRYIGRPVMSQSRISNYDGENVTFWYQPHGSTEIVTETVSAFDFIKKLIIHIPDPNFKMLRYYGFYCVRNRKYKQYLLLAKKLEAFHSTRLKNIYASWAKRISYWFWYDPLKCVCGHYYEFFGFCYPKPYKNKNISLPYT